MVKIDGTNPCHTEFSYTHSICQGSSYLFNGIQRDTSGLYIDTLVNAFACDSIIRVSLEVIDALMPELVINSNLGNVICQDTQVVFTANAINGGTVPIYQWQKNGINTGTGSSTYSINNLVNGDSIICILTSNLNCISSPTVNSNSIIMTVNSLPPMPTIIANGNVLSSSANNGNQWYLNGNLIPGANGQSLTANQNGNYTVLVTNNCGSTSSGIFTYSITSINNHEQLYFTIYPNPTRNNFSILGLNINEKFSVNIIDNTGRVIQNFYNHDVIDVSSLAEGFYWVEIIQNNTKNISKLIKY